jgi:hypothetical protein
MGKTPQEIASLPVNSPEKRQWLLTASARDIQTFIDVISKSDYSSRDYEVARTALEIRIAEDQAQTAERLEKQVAGLAGIAAEQKRLAEKLDVQTDRLVGLTVWLKWLTVALVLLTAVLCFLELRRH